ncbi:MAG: HlyD family efflux transporter periplasmic adaptor subunit [Pseudomonadota bacterium]
MFIVSRAPILGAIGSLILALSACAGLAGPGHDHGAAPATAAGPASPRVVAVSESHEFVGIWKDGRLTVYLDRLRDTSPVLGAKIELTIDGQTQLAEPQDDGTYVAVSSALEQHGVHDVIVVVETDGGNDLLVGTLNTSKEKIFDHDHADHHHDDEGAQTLTSRNDAADTSQPMAPGGLRDFVARAGLKSSLVHRVSENAALVAGIGAVIGLAIGALMSARAGLVIALLGLVTVLGAGVASAGPGHDHGGGGATAIQGDAPRRLPDGRVFLPKPTQRLLDIRTTRLVRTDVRRSERLIGRIIADPNRSGLVQSTIGGRITPADGGLPTLGQQVTKGQVLAYVEPAFAPIDASDVRQTAGDLEQRIAVLDARIARQKPLVDKGVVNAASLEDLEIERAGLDARRQQLTRSRTAHEQLVAPVTGVITDVHIAAGQVVDSADTVFSIVDPSSLWVEAISFDPTLVLADARARARLADNTFFDLSFVGRSRALQQQATVLQFRFDRPSDALSVGSPVNVIIERGEAVNGLVLPRRAIAQAPNGQMVAFKRLEPESYLPSAVSIQDIDSERVLITKGLAQGDQVIVQGALLVNQIR